jgi:hypothetical protein
VSTISRRLIWRVSLRSSIPTISYMPDNSTRRPIPSGYTCTNVAKEADKTGRVVVAPGTATDVEYVCVQSPSN